MKWNKYLYILPIVLLISLMLCKKQPDLENISEINKAVTRLQNRSNSDAFLIIEATPSRRYYQLYKVDNVIYFQFPINSVSLINIPNIIRRGNIVMNKPTLKGDFEIQEYIPSEEVPALQNLLRQFGLNDKVIFETGYHPTEDKIVNYISLIEGQLYIQGEALDRFSKGYFKDICKLSNFRIHLIEN